MYVPIRSGLLAVVSVMVLASVSAQQPATPRTLTISADRTTARQWEAWAVAMERSGELRMRERQSDSMLPGREHERLDQFYGGVPVFGAGITRQWRDGQIESVFGRVYDGLTVNVAPTLTAAQATERAGCTRSFGRAELMVLGDLPAPALTWRVRCHLPGDIAQFFVNAHSGRIERRLTSLHRQSAVGDGRGVYFDRKKISVRQQGTRFTADDALRPPQLITFDLQGNLARAIRILELDEAPRPSDVASDGDNLWEDGAVVDAHVYVGLTYDYFFKRFGRRGLDNRDVPLLTIIHPVTQEGALTLDAEDLFTFAVNAFWCSGCGPGERGMMLFGDGIPPEFFLGDTGHSVTFLAASIDIAAHELTHGVTDYSSRLIFEGESGALNEAFSDIMGTSVEFFYQPAGAAIGQADYKIGEDSFQAVAADSIDGIRSMAVPTAFGDPDHYSERFTGREDNGGVHINSGIVNHVFYLAIEGGTHRVSRVVVPGVGPQNREQIEKVFFRAFTLFLPPNATFSLARAATLQAARDLFGAGGAVEQAVLTAWTAVGVQ